MKPNYGDQLRADLGTPTWRRKLASSPRSLVWLAEVNSTPVVVKQVVGGTDAEARFTREVTALRLAGRAEPAVAPALLGVDVDQQVMVLEYLTGEPQSDDWVIGYATALAGLHATTTSADADALPRWTPPGARDVVSFLALAMGLDMEVPRPAVAELDNLLHRLAEPTGFALLHGDPCPGNDLHTTTGVRFVDFEQASFGDGLTELAYLRIGFPTCWCSTVPPAPLLAEAENAYRDTWRAATGSTPAGDLADACVGWLLRGDALVQLAERDKGDHLAALRRKDWAWGTATARQRLAHRLGVVAELTAGHDRLAAVGRFSADLRARMLAGWPELAPLPASRLSAPIMKRSLRSWSSRAAGAAGPQTGIG
ncbi:MAG TPA: aminoglycoside phosphotransferase family protein [Pseudonocardiaceae bacterium]|nr:aminoglycoside phosphotransferase family protein [Pseudonocardiaceae bacterium]